MTIRSHVTSVVYLAALWLLLSTAARAGQPSLSGAPLFSARYDDAIRSAVKTYWPDLPFWKLWKSQLIQESHLDPDVCSQAGACGLAQFMGPTWADITKQIGQPGTSRFDARVSIEAGAYYMHGLRHQWAGRNREVLDSHDLGLASYNAGTGSILRAQQSCNDALLWGEIAPCLESVTGSEHAKETRNYVVQIHRYWKILIGE